MSDLLSMKKSVERAFAEVGRAVPDIEVTDCLNIGDYQIWQDGDVWTLGITVYVVEVLYQGNATDVARRLVHHMHLWSQVKKPSERPTYPIVIEGRLLNKDVSVEDGGQAIIGELSDGVEDGFFVRLQSWSETKDHPVMLGLMGRKIRVTVEVFWEV